MTLREFMKTDTYMYASCVEYVNADGVEIDKEYDSLLDLNVMDHHSSSGGYLEIQLQTDNE